MSSELQSIFLSNIAATIRATNSKLQKKLDLNSDSKAVIWQELNSIVHGLLCEIDGATSLADHGLISIIDEDGNTFSHSLHDKYLDELTDEELSLLRKCT